MKVTFKSLYPEAMEKIKSMQDLVEDALRHVREKGRPDMCKTKEPAAQGEPSDDS